MNTGEKDQYLSVEVNNPTTTASNATVDDWQHNFYMWAKKVTSTAKEVLKGDQIQIDKVVFVMDECGLTNKNRLVDEDGLVYQVESVVEKNHDLIVTCKLNNE